MNFGNILRRIELFLNYLKECNGKAFFTLDRANEIYLLKLLDMMGIEICITMTSQYEALKNSDLNFHQTIEHTYGRLKKYVKQIVKSIHSFTISDMDSLKYIIESCDDCNLLLSIDINDTVESFGVSIDDCDEYLNYAKENNHPICGIFSNPQNVKELYKLINIIEKCNNMGNKIYYLYIGSDLISNNIKSEEIKKLLDKIKIEYGVSVYCDLSDYILYKCSYLYCKVTGKRVRDNHNYLYLNDGIYGTLDETLYQVDNFECQTLIKKSNKMMKTTLFGPTGDSIDTIAKDIDMLDANIDDWIIITGQKFCPNTLTSFNAFDTSSIIYLFC